MNNKCRRCLNRFCLILVSFAAAFSQVSFAGDEPLIKFYGFVLPTVIFSTQAVESYSRPNASAFTAAGNPVLAYQPAESRLTFQLAQSRIGLTAGDKSKLMGRLEFDFIDFHKPSPTTTMVPRVRRAAIQYALNETDTLVAGQEWDIFSPLGPHTYNLVGRYFQAGDTAFMRDQIYWIRTHADYEVALAVGLQGSNPSGTSGNGADSTLELSKRPTLAARVGLMLPEGGRVGISGIATQLLVDPTIYYRRTAYGANGYFEMNFFEKTFNLRSEIYLGRNLANLGALSLAYGNNYYDTAEAGGWISGRVKAGEVSGVYAGFGFARVLNASAMPSSYTSISQGGFTSYSLGATGPGIERNYQVKVGLDYKPETKLTLFGEASYFNTRHHLQKSDAVRFDPQRVAVVALTGIMLEL